MFTSSIWTAFSDVYDFPELTSSLSVDVAVIGGGITGISTALDLADKGYSVAVLEALKIGGGTSSHNTGNLYCTTDKNLDFLREKYDGDTIRKVVNARKAAVNRIEANVTRFQLDCDFGRRDWHLYSALPENDELIEKELEAAREAGIDAFRAGNEDMPMPVTKALKVPGQAQLNPMRYVQELAKVIASESLQVFEYTRVIEVNEKEDMYELVTTKGNVKARHVVMATHTPKGVKFIQTLLGPYREYGIGCRLKEPGSFPKGIFWGYYQNGEKFSVRSYSRGGEDFILVIGKPHKVGQADDNARKIRELEEFAHGLFDVQEVVYRWGGQHYRPADLLPYIGRESKDKTSYIATGYSTDGLVYGTLAGMIISDLVVGDENEWVDLFDPSRHQPLKAAASFIKENINVAKQYLKDLPGHVQEENFRDVKHGEGKIVEKDGEKIAAFRDESGELHLCSATCTHMGCVVNWNNVERTWDCPCHGSRFKTDGTVLEGPAYHPLHHITLRGSQVEVDETK